jgi:cell division protein ZapA
MSTPSDKHQVAVTIRILDKEYQFTCLESERYALLDSAKYLNDQMKQIRDRGKIMGMDRIAVMAALNLAHEVLELQRERQTWQVTEQRLQAMSEKMEDFMAKPPHKG